MYHEVTGLIEHKQVHLDKQGRRESTTTAPAARQLVVLAIDLLRAESEATQNTPGLCFCCVDVELRGQSSFGLITVR